MKRKKRKIDSDICNVDQTNYLKVSRHKQTQKKKFIFKTKSQGVKRREKVVEEQVQKRKKELGRKFCNATMKSYNVNSTLKYLLNCI